MEQKIERVENALIEFIERAASKDAMDCEVQTLPGAVEALVCIWNMEHY